jgi:riboflavin synthase
MFTGIIQVQGSVVALRRGTQDARLTIALAAPGPDLAIGQSIAVNGVCLTVTERNGSSFTGDLSPETLERTTLGGVQPREQVNVEFPLRLGDSVGGHFVTGHVDGVGPILRREAAGESAWMWIGVPPFLTPYIAPKGSIAADGVSLTVVEVSGHAFSVSLIPHTLATTTLGRKGAGDRVNLEVDVLSRYVERLFAGQRLSAGPRLTREVLHEQGFA